MSLFKVVFGKAFHLPMEIKDKAYWEVKAYNMYNAQAIE